MPIRSRAKSIKFGGISLDEWLDVLLINALPYDVYERHSLEECAWLVLNYWLNSKPRRWGWSWGSWLSFAVFDGNEYYDALSYEEKERLDRMLLRYLEELAEKVEKDERKVAKLEKELRKLLGYLD